MPCLRGTFQSGWRWQTKHFQGFDSPFNTLFHHCSLYHVLRIIGIAWIHCDRCRLHMYAKGKNGSDKKAPPLPHPFQKINARQRGSLVPRLFREKCSVGNCLFNFCSVWFKNWWRNIFKNVLCYLKQSLKVRKSPKEMARCRDHPGAPERHSQNMKPCDNLIDIWKLTLPVFKLRNTHTPVHRSASFLHWSFSGSTWFSLCIGASTA